MGPGWMLSVRRRQEDAPGRGGAVAQSQLRARMDDDAELEEGEACADDTAFVDPDVALSYIVSCPPRPPSPASAAAPAPSSSALVAAYGR